MAYTRLAPRPATLGQLFAAWIGRRSDERRLARDGHLLDAMPCDRLEDIGLPPRTSANRRTSGMQGPPPKTQLW